MSTSTGSFVPHVMVGTPAYGGMVHVDFVNSLLEFRNEGILYSLVTIGNESLITRARNTLVAAFMSRPEFTHLLFLDGDVRLPASGLRRLLSHQRDVIGAPVALKGRTASGARIFNLGRSFGEEGPLLINERIGTAAFMLSRRAVTALVQDAVAQGFAYRRASTQRGDDQSQVHYDVFRVGVIADEYLSEDYWVCRRLWQLGFPVYVDPGIVTEHNGSIRV